MTNTVNVAPTALFDMLVATEDEIRVLDTILTLGSVAGTPIHEINRRADRLASLRARVTEMFDGMSFAMFREFHNYRTAARAA